MSTIIKVEFNEQSKTVVASTKVESDELEADEVLDLAKDLAVKAQNQAQVMSMRKL